MHGGKRNEPAGRDRVQGAARRIMKPVCTRSRTEGVHACLECTDVSVRSAAERCSRLLCMLRHWAATHGELAFPCVFAPEAGASPKKC